MRVRLAKRFRGAQSSTNSFAHLDALVFLHNRAGELGPLPSQGVLLTQYTVFHSILCHYALRVKPAGARVLVVRCRQGSWGSKNTELESGVVVSGTKIFGLFGIIFW